MDKPGETTTRPLGALPNQPSTLPAVNLSNEKIAQVSLVVQDVGKVARRFSEILGVSWKFYDVRLKEVLLHSKMLGE